MRTDKHYTTNKRRLQGVVCLVAFFVALIVVMSTNAGRVQATTDGNEPLKIGQLIIRAKAQEPEQSVLIHDKRTVSKAPARVEIEETHEERTESEQERTVCESEPTLRYLGNWKVTGYDICMKCCGNTNGVTASGTTATVGRTCAAGKDLPFGTVLYIEGIGYRTVEDRGGGVNGGHIDVLCNDHPECYSITGHYDVYVVEEVQE